MGKREINPYGMYLREQKENCKKKSLKLDLEAVLKSWKSFTGPQRAKYEKMSLEDRESLKMQRQLESKKGKTSFEKQEIRKMLKNKKDLELKSYKREEHKALRKDVDSSKIVLKLMIAEKKERFKKLVKEVETNEKELECLSTELSVSEQLLQNKKEMVNMYKKEYKELFSNNLSMKKQ